VSTIDGAACGGCGGSLNYAGEACPCGGQGRGLPPAVRAAARKLRQADLDRAAYDKGRLRAQAFILRGQVRSSRSAAAAAERRRSARQRAAVGGNTRAALRYMDGRL
jgi:hypothetical protein